MINDKKKMIKELTKAGASIIEYYIDQAESAGLDQKQAQINAMQELSKMRYGIKSKDYFWIINYQPVMLMHPYRPELVGSDLTNYRDHEDKSGKYLFREAVEIVRSNGNGFLEYYWQWMDDPDTSALKMSYVMDIPQWSWILGTGIYINDIEDEMKEITSNLIQTSVILLLILFVFLLIVVYQSRVIEHKRQKAESGLEEAKNRYRSLVESSNEGYMLIIDNTIIYANKKMHQILDYDESGFRLLQVDQLFVRKENDDYYDLDNLYALCEKGSENSWIEVQLISKNNDIIDLRLRVSRVFWSDTNAFLLTVRTSKQFQNSLILNSLGENSGGVEDIINEINKSNTIGHCLFSLERLPHVVFQQINSNSYLKRNAITLSYEALAQKIIELTGVWLETKYGSSMKNVNFTFLHLGSNSRGEMTFFSDQDNALVYEDPLSPEGENDYNRYFLELSGLVCAELKKAGFSYCPGGIQASNPQWCMALSQWKLKIKNWFEQYDGKSMLEANVFADMNVNRQSSTLKSCLHDYFYSLINNNSSFIQAFANSSLQIHIPENVFGRTSSKLIDGEQKINIKEYLKVIEIAARLYSLKYGIEKASTLDRLNVLRKNNILHFETYIEIKNSFEQLWDLRFNRQLESFGSLLKTDDTIPVSQLSPNDKKMFQSILYTIKSLVLKMNHDFLGTVL